MIDTPLFLKTNIGIVVWNHHAGKPFDDIKISRKKADKPPPPATFPAARDSEPIPS
jgi:hypothetical protein